MDFLTVLFISLGLAMDACAVSVSSGISIKNLRIVNAIKIALFFGVFQAIMPLIGYLVGEQLKDLITSVDHWIAFGLLVLIGAKMIYEALKKEPENKKEFNPLKLHILLMLAVATSIDALAVGVSFAFLEKKSADISIFLAIFIIGMITFILSYISCFIGKKFGQFFKNEIEIIGGIILIGIGIKILVEHLS